MVFPEAFVLVEIAYYLVVFMCVHVYLAMCQVVDMIGTYQETDGKSDV